MGAAFKLRNGSLLIITEAPGGIYNSEQLKRIALLADEDSAIVKVTEDQRLALFVDENKINEIAEQLKEMGLGVRHYQDGLHQPTSCIGELCSEYQQDALQSAIKVSEELANIQLDAPLKIGINGCGRCCVPCHTLDISVVGDEQGYKISIGGKGTLVAEMASFAAEGVPEAELPQLLKKVVSLYRENAEEGESLQEVIERVGVSRFVKVLLPYSQDAAGGAEEIFSSSSDEDAVAGEPADNAEIPEVATTEADPEEILTDELSDAEDALGFDETIDEQTQKDQADADFDEEPLLDSHEDEIGTQDLSDDVQDLSEDAEDLSEEVQDLSEDAEDLSEEVQDLSEDAEDLSEEVQDLSEDVPMPGQPEVDEDQNIELDPSEPIESIDDIGSDDLCENEETEDLLSPASEAVSDHLAPLAAASSDADEANAEVDEEQLGSDQVSGEDSAEEVLQSEELDLDSEPIDPDLEEDGAGSAFEERFNHDIDDFKSDEGDDPDVSDRDHIVKTVEDGCDDPVEGNNQVSLVSKQSSAAPQVSPLALQPPLEKNKRLDSKSVQFNDFSISASGDFTLGFSSGLSFQFNSGIVTDGARRIQIADTELTISLDGGALVVDFADGLRMTLPTKAA